MTFRITCLVIDAVFCAKKVYDKTLGRIIP
jgi:hypothetical protein